MDNLNKICEYFNINTDQAVALQNISTQKIYNEGDIVFYQGDKSNQLIFLESGYLGAYHVDDDYKSTFFHLFKPPCFVAEPFSIKNIPYRITVKAFTKSHAILLDFQKFQKILLENPNYLKIMMYSLCDKLDNYFKFANREKHNDIFGKICIFIYEHEELFSKIKHKDSAFILNISPQILSRFLKKLKDEKILSSNGTSWKVLDKDKLKKYASSMEE